MIAALAALECASGQPALIAALRAIRAAADDGAAVDMVRVVELGRGAKDGGRGWTVEVAAEFGAVLRAVKAKQEGK